MKRLILAVALALAACGPGESKVAVEMIRYEDACARLAFELSQAWQQDVSWEVCEIGGVRHCVCVTAEPPLSVGPCEWIKEVR